MKQFFSLSWAVMLEWAVYCLNILIRLIQRNIQVFSNNLQEKSFFFSENPIEWNISMVCLMPSISSNHTPENNYYHDCVQTTFLEKSVRSLFKHPSCISNEINLPQTKNWIVLFIPIFDLNNTPLEVCSTPPSTPITVIFYWLLIAM